MHLYCDSVLDVLDVGHWGKGEGDLCVPQPDNKCQS